MHTHIYKQAFNCLILKHYSLNHKGQSESGQTQPSNNTCEHVERYQANVGSRETLQMKPMQHVTPNESFYCP